MSMTSTDKIFNVNEQEYGFCINSFKPVASGNTIDMYIPKLMGGMSSSSENKSITPENVAINNLFDNARECKPTFSNKIIKANSLSVVLKDNCNWLNKVSSSGIVPRWTMFTIEFLNGCISRPYVTTK